jgi:hypothetical protein
MSRRIGRSQAVEAVYPGSEGQKLTSAWWGSLSAIEGWSGQRPGVGLPSPGAVDQSGRAPSMSQPTWPWTTPLAKSTEIGQVR